MKYKSYKEMPIRCPKCGYYVDKESMMCGKCGCDLEKEGANENVGTEGSSKKR